ncbi:MAG: adenylate/guanylate cyclase domain-containing protein [bacterium]
MIRNATNVLGNLSLFWKVFLTALLVTFIPISVLMFYSLETTNDIFENQLSEKISIHHRNLSETIKLALHAHEYDKIDEIIRDIQSDPDISYVGIMLGDGQLHQRYPEEKSLEDFGFKPDLKEEVVLNSDMGPGYLARARTLSIPEINMKPKFILIGNKSKMEARRNSYIRNVSLLGILAILLAGGISFLVARHLSSRINDLLTASSEISKGYFSKVQLNDYYQDEVGQLYNQFGEMSDQLENAWDQIEKEKQRSEELLFNLLPREVTNRIKQGEEIADFFEDVTVLFADIVGFTQISQEHSVEDIVSLLDDLFTSFDGFVEEYGIEKIKTIGDEYFVVAGAPEPIEKHAFQCARFAFQIQDFLEEFEAPGVERLKLRIGMNTGPIMGGIIGQEKFMYDVWGDTVNVASRMESNGQPGKIHVTDATRRSIKRQDTEDYFHFTHKGTYSIKGGDEIDTFFLERNGVPLENKS